MAKQRLKHRLIGWLRTFRILYSTLSFAKKFSAKVFMEALRILTSPFPSWGPPSGVVSGLAFNEGKEGRLILKGQTLKPAREGSLRIRCGMNQNGMQPWPIFWLHRKSARLVGMSLALLEPGKKLLSESVYGEEFYHRDPAYNTIHLPKAVELKGAYTSVISWWRDGYYHWLMDGLPRLACLDSFPTKTRILVPPKLERFHRESLQMLGLESRCRPTAETHLIIEDYYFSAPTTMTGCDNPHALAFLRKSFLNRGRDVPAIGNRIFLKRRAKTRGLLNELAVEEFFLGNGWSLVDLEELSLAQQIGLFQRIDAVAGMHGGGFTNIAWCKPGCQVLELCADNFLNGCYEGMADYLDLDYSYLVFKGNGAFNIRVDLEEVARKLKLGF